MKSVTQIDDISVTASMDLFRKVESKVPGFYQHTLQALQDYAVGIAYVFRLDPNYRIGEDDALVIQTDVRRDVLRALVQASTALPYDDEVDLIVHSCVEYVKTVLYVQLYYHEVERRLYVALGCVSDDTLELIQTQSLNFVNPPTLSSIH